MTTNNKNQNLRLFLSAGVLDGESLEAHAMDAENSPSVVKEIFGSTLADMYEQAKETLALTMQQEASAPREYALKLAQTGLYEMALVKVDLVHVAFVDVFNAAARYPQEFLSEWSSLLESGEILVTPID
jgi:hypothetical protein